MGTMLIPLFMIKEGKRYGYPELKGAKAEKINLFKSIWITIKNKQFRNWLLVNGCTFFGLQMFLSSMNGLIIGGMGLNGAQMAILNTCAFAPVPVMLYLFNKVKAKKGVRFTYQTCLISFAVSILSFFFGSLFITGGNKPVQYLIGCLGGVMGSWAIGAFFMMSYLSAAQISSVEERITKQNHSAMYFAGNAVATSIVGAISGSLIYENIKMIFFTKSGDFTWAESFAEAAVKFGIDEANIASSVFNFGTMLVPFIVAIVCILGAVLAFRLPKDFTPILIAKEFKKQDPSLDISEIENDPTSYAKEEKGEIIFVQIGLSVLSGFIFGWIWAAYLLKSVKELTGKYKNILGWALSCFCPFASIYFMMKAYDDLKEVADAKGVKLVGNKALYIALSSVFFLLPLNIVGLALMQHNVNKLYKAEEEAEKAEAVEVEAVAEV